MVWRRSTCKLLVEAPKENPKNSSERKIRNERTEETQSGRSTDEERHTDFFDNNNKKKGTKMAA
jgi:hypothetical protein